MEMKMMNDLIRNAHFQINKMNWEEKVQNFTDNTWECLCDNVTDITNVKKTLENDILSSIYMMQHSLLKIDAFQKRKMGLNKYCSTIRLLIYDRLNKCIAMLDNILAAMQFIIIEIDKQFDSIYSVNRYIALFNELYQQFQHNHQVFHSN
ncbi:Uncharacterized protein BM_BM17293 [Brugia malayi]|uniref:Bm48 n=1 Tax=Brugia malayi TaxID=6279 RepID=A0A0K0JG79_BRUMA|nr:Uncharacterized protein BM_BM17293 [Brugia malayi]CDP90888.2 Bm48 [Brugia malayi]VIP00500.1 Uncharacterized protein BM_BM17293 [Brugia malayi]